ILGFGGVATALQLERARGRHPDEAVDGGRAVLRGLVMFALLTPLWSLFDQKASTRVLQAGAMDRPAWVDPSEMQAINRVLVMILIPINNLVVFPLLRRLGWEPTALRRMTIGIALTAASWVVVGAMQLALDAGTHFSIGWQILPYALLTLGE